PFCRRLKRGTFFYNIIMTLSKYFRLGDPFDVKGKNCPPPPLPIQGALVERADCQAASVNQAGNS
ncbi:MAG: hypothetical protein LBC27_09885, partial [Spirochaetaceae bacterium]|nr:hypothetical protein [Spirochaetaceae bacterium]